MVEFETILSGEELNNQGPTALDTAHQITYGPPLNNATDPVMLLADGSIVINESGSYSFVFSATHGRVGSAGISELFFRLLINGVQVGASVHIQLTDADVLGERSTTFSASLPAGTIITGEVIREGSGNNSGDLIAGLPAPGSWNNPASAAVVVGRWVIPL